MTARAFRVLRALQAPQPRPQLEHLTPLDVIQRGTGCATAAGRFRSRVVRERASLDNDLVMAEKLRGAGIQVFKERRTTWLGGVTGRAMPMSTLREINLFETRQVTSRSDYLKFLTRYLELTPGSEYTRLAVVTSGERILPGEDLRGKKKTVQTRIQKWGLIVKKLWDIELIFISPEYTIDKETHSFHLHFNVLMRPINRLSKQEWSDFLRFSCQHFGTWWKDNGVLRDPKEAVKYILKGVDRDRLSAEECAWLYRETFHQRFITPYNSLARFISEMNNARQKLKYVSPAAGGAKQLRTVQMPPKQPKPESKSEPDPHQENIILGSTGPMARACAWAEPGILIQNYTPDAKTPAGRARLAEATAAMAEARLYWDRNGAPAPEIALAVSDAWLLAADDQAAERIVPLNPKNVAFIVHTTDLTHHGGEGQTGADPPLSSGTNARLPEIAGNKSTENSPNKCELTPFRPGEGWVRLASGEWMDGETGEIC